MVEACRPYRHLVAHNVCAARLGHFLGLRELVEVRGLCAATAENAELNAAGALRQEGARGAREHRQRAGLNARIDVRRDLAGAWRDGAPWVALRVDHVAGGVVN